MSASRDWFKRLIQTLVPETGSRDWIKRQVPRDWFKTLVRKLVEEMSKQVVARLCHGLRDIPNRFSCPKSAPHT